MKLRTLNLRTKKAKGQSLAEYGLILALIACACIAALTMLGDKVGTGMNAISGAIEGAIGTGVAAGAP